MLTIHHIHYSIRDSFTISRGSKTSADVVQCFIQRGGLTGRAECVPYARYGETPSGVEKEIAAIRPLLAENAPRKAVLAAMNPGAARNAVDCALWDLEAKTRGKRVAAMLGIRTEPVITAFTLSLDTPDAMYRQAKANSSLPLLKIKVGDDNDIARMKAVRDGAPAARLIVDANEGWNARNLPENMQAARACGVCLVEQPLPAGHDGLLATIPHDVPVCADESVHTSADLDKVAGLYDAVNIKLDKTGGLTEARRLKEYARRQGLLIMVGCMVASSLAMAPAVLLAQDADFVDLDGPLLLEQDCEYGLRYTQGRLSAPDVQLWG